MKKEHKKGSTVLIFAILVVLLLGVIGLLIWDLIGRINRGWNNNDTILVIFIVFLIVVGPFTANSLLDYCIYRNKRILFLNNEIYRKFIFLDKSGHLLDFEKRMIEIDNEKSLTMINYMIFKKSDEQVVLIDNLKDFYDERFDEYIGKQNINVFKRIIVGMKCREILSNKSLRFEKLYQSVYGGDIIRKRKFPLIESIIPILFTAMGMFATVYSSLSVDGGIKDSLFSYLGLFIETVAIIIVWTFYSFDSKKDAIIKSNQEIVELLNLAISSNKNIKPKACKRTKK